MVDASVDVSALIRAKLRKKKYVYKMYHPSFISSEVEIIVHRIVHFVLAFFENIFNNVIKWNVDHGSREYDFSRECARRSQRYYTQTENSSQTKQNSDHEKWRANNEFISRHT